MWWTEPDILDIPEKGICIGQKYSRLTVKSIQGRGGNIECICDCGNIVFVPRCRLLSSRTVSCGCKRRGTNLIGMRFGRLKVIESLLERTASRGSKWLCICDCGKKIILPRNHLSNGHTQSCGCKQADSKQHRKVIEYGEISGYYFGQIRRSADARDLDFNISAEYIWNIFIEQNRCCALTGLRIHLGNRGSTRKMIKRSNPTASLDRIDNSKGYDKGNVRWVYKEINRMRGGLSDGEFLKLCSLIVEHNRNS